MFSNFLQVHFVSPRAIATVKRNDENLDPNPMILLQEHCRKSWRSRRKLDQLYDIQEYNSKRGNVGIISNHIGLSVICIIYPIPCRDLDNVGAVGAAASTYFEES